MKTKYSILGLLFSSILVLSACGGQSLSSKGTEEKQEEPAAQVNTETTGSEDFEGLLQLQTKNTTRLPAKDHVEASLYTSQTIWPATHEGNKPNAVILAPEEDWQTSLAAADLIHHPVNGPVMLYDKNGLDDRSLEEIKRLEPLGMNDGTQIILVGDDNENVQDQLKEYQLHQIEGEGYAETAKNIDDYYAKMNHGYPDSVIIVSGDDKHKLFSLPVVNWIAHMSEPVLFVSENKIPEATKQALENRDNPNLYIVGPNKAIPNKIENELAEYGNTKRISGQTPVENSIEFAMYKDEETGFGWGLQEPGHGISLISDKTEDYALTAAPFSHLGKHAPLIWLPEGEQNADVEEFLAMIKPTFEDDPSKGPYNHAFITGNTPDISVETQGMIDHQLEIVQANGQGHGGH